MIATDELSSASSNQLSIPRNDVLSKFGLIFVAPWDSKIERFAVDIKRLKQLPFFGAFDRFMKEFFKRNGVTDHQISYVIWGGLAANLMLSLIGRSGIHYSLHDIELFFLKGGQIYQPKGLIEALKKDFSSNECFLLEVGGQPIVKALEGESVEDFQKQRIHRNDGDLYLNSVILIADHIERRVFVEAPSGTFRGLIAGENGLEMKDASDLRHIDQLARRIYRNISKSIRFQQVAGLMLTTETKHQLESLIDSYSNKLDDYFCGSLMPPEEKDITEEWLVNANIVSLESGKRWLFLKTLSETAKRLAGLQGLSSLDQAGFCRFLLGEEPNVNTLFDHPLIQLVRNNLTDSTWPSGAAIKLDISQQCYLDFFKYQKPGAEKLHEVYSLNLVR